MKRGPWIPGWVSTIRLLKGYFTPHPRVLPGPEALSQVLPGTASRVAGGMTWPSQPKLPTWQLLLNSKHQGITWS